MANDPFQESSSVRKILGSSKKRPIPPYFPSRSLGRKKRAPKRFNFDVTIFQNPGGEVLARTDIQEKNLTMLGVSNVMLLEDMTAEQVKAELIELLQSFTKVAESENIDFIYLRKNGRKRNFQVRHFSSTYIYDAMGLKDIAGKDSKHLYIVLSKVLSFNQKSKVSRINVTNYDYGDDIVSDSDHEYGSSLLSSRNSDFLNCSTSTIPSSSTKQVKNKNDPISIDTAIRNVTESLEGSYPIIRRYQKLMAALILLRHIRAFTIALTSVIEAKIEHAKEIEHLLAQSFILFEENNRSGLDTALSHLSLELNLTESDSCSCIVEKIVNSIRTLDCKIWSDLFLQPCLSSNLTSEYCHSGGFHESTDKDVGIIKFVSDDSSTTEALFADYTSRTRTSEAPDALTLMEGESAWRRRYFSKLPEMMFCGYNSTSKKIHKIDVVEQLPKVMLEDIRSVNDGSYNITAFISTDGEICVAGICQKSGMWKFYCEGSVFCGEISGGSIWEVLNRKQFYLVFASYSSLDHVEDIPDIADLKHHGKFLVERLKKNSQFSGRDVFNVTDDTQEGEYEALLRKLDSRLNGIYGQCELKTAVRKWARHVVMEKHKRDLGAITQTKAEMISSLHMVLVGNPGTGKTTVARCMAGILFDIGVIDSDEVVEVQRGDLVSNYIGDTARKTEEVIRKSSGKILFVDEAYTLSSKSEKDFGKEALETMMRYMLPPPTSNKTKYPIFVFCGYESNMEEFLQTNRGLQRRIKLKFTFTDYTPKELFEIMVSMLLKQRVRFPYGLEADIVKCFSSISTEVRSNFNASLVEDLLAEVRSIQEARLTFAASLNDVMRYEKDDFEKGMRHFLKRFAKKLRKDQGSQTPSGEVLLHIEGVGIVPGSPWK